jgi:hypothetical protein
MAGPRQVTDRQSPHTRPGGIDKQSGQSRIGSALARASKAIRLCDQRGHLVERDHVRPVGRRAVGVLMGFDEHPAMPSDTAARAMTGANSRCPPDDPP